MTLEEAVQAAENGNIGAMNALGQYYFENNEVGNACEWYERAATNGHTPSFPMAMMLNATTALSLQGLQFWEQALEFWSNTQKWCGAIIKEADLFSEEAVDLAIKHFKDSCYGIGYNLYRMKRFQEAMKLLRSNVDEDSRCKLLFGLCAFECHGDDAVSGLKEAYNYLMVAENDCPDIADDLIFQALMLLANLYRHAHIIHIPGVRTDIARAYQCVEKAAMLPDEIGVAAQEELKKYSKGLFGSYTYNG